LESGGRWCPVRRWWRRADDATAARSATEGRDGGFAPAEAAEVALLHRRLSIIDLDPRANQPITSADGRYGEIYNYVELRETLKRDGHVFRTTSDTEVLIAAYANWGEKALGRFVAVNDAPTVLSFAQTTAPQKFTFQ
jgi:asparagine synthetase B (glutamine-hydrolysing)